MTKTKMTVEKPEIVVVDNGSNDVNKESSKDEDRNKVTR